MALVIQGLLANAASTNSAATIESDTIDLSQSKTAIGNVYITAPSGTRIGDFYIQQSQDQTTWVNSDVSPSGYGSVAVNTAYELSYEFAFWGAKYARIQWVGSTNGTGTWNASVYVRE